MLDFQIVTDCILAPRASGAIHVHSSQTSEAFLNLSKLLPILKGAKASSIYIYKLQNHVTTACKPTIVLFCLQ